VRARLVRPEFWTDSTVALMPDSTRLFYIGLWCIADDAGFIEWDEDAIGMQLLGYRSPAARRRVITAAVKTLVGAGRVKLLECGRHAVIPTLPRHAITGGNKSERVKTAHSEHGVRTSPAESGTSTTEYRSVSPSSSPLPSVSPSPPKTNGSKDPVKAPPQDEQQIIRYLAELKDASTPEWKREVIRGQLSFLGVTP
jgi:hypothetical protein